tara:strand:+ start:4724 stop:4828 length:105 start_codon:yes stop_codon:yes gene_type:complete
MIWLNAIAFAFCLYIGIVQGNLRARKTAYEQENE